MPTNHEVVSALPISSAANQTLLRNLLVQRMAYVVSSAAAATDLVAVDPTTGTTILVIICLGRNFLYDPADTTTVHDGVTCLVTSDGKRYKLAAENEVVVFSVLDYTDTPPGSPAIGDAYLTGSSPTGAWAGNVRDIAVYTARGWEFITPVVGRFIYVEDEDAYYHRKADGTMVVGFGTQALGAATVLASNMHSGAGTLRHIVENMTRTTAPGVVADGVKYIVAAGATGAWAGHDAKLAIGENGAWVIYTPAEGWKIYDKNTDTDYLYSGSAWIGASGDLLCKLTAFEANGTFTKQPRCVFAEIHVQAEGGASSVGAGTSSSFGAHFSATAGAQEVAGAGVGGEINVSGQTATAGGRGGGIFNSKGHGAASGAGNGAGGGYAAKVIQNASLGATEAVTIGATRAANGFVLVREFYRA